jgi:hypothetical protein
MANILYASLCDHAITLICFLLSLLFINLDLRMFIAVLSHIYHTKLSVVKIIMDYDNTTLQGQQRGRQPWVRLRLNVRTNA